MLEPHAELLTPPNSDCPIREGMLQLTPLPCLLAQCAGLGRKWMANQNQAETTG
jgi:hypothetical protein